MTILPDMFRDTLSALEWFAQAFTARKILFERSLSFSDDVIHVLVGLVIQGIAAALLRTSLKDWRPLAVVIAAEIGNEILDVTYDVWPVPAMQLGESIKDVVLTLIVPVMLMVLTRAWPSLFVGYASPGHDERAREEAAP